MKRFVFTFIITIVLSCSALAQDIREDSIFVGSKSIDAIQNIQFRFEEFDLHRETYRHNLHIPLDVDKSTLQLRTEMIISQSIGDNYYSERYNFNFLKPIYNKYLEESKFNLVRYVLGAAQLGAVGYLAYRHIKKYGFID